MLNTSMTSRAHEESRPEAALEPDVTIIHVLQIGGDNTLLPSPIKRLVM